MADIFRVRIISADGSTPREVGASMIVKASGTTGTIGGGRMEFEAIQMARSLIETGKGGQIQSVPLGPDIGQCCGGRVTLEFEPDPPPSFQKMRTPLLIFGGGHVGRALVQAFLPLPFDISVVENRSDYLSSIDRRVRTQLLAAPEAAVRTAPSGACFIVTTHEHSLDFLVVEEALKRGDARYIGMIGSASKRAVLEKRLRAESIDPGSLVCPIGAAGLGDKRPEIIATFTAAEVLCAARNVE